MQPEAVDELRLEDQLGGHVLGERSCEVGDARRMGRRLAEASAPVVVQFQRTRERLDGRRCRLEIGTEECRVGFSHSLALRVTPHRPFVANGQCPLRGAVPPLLGVPQAR